MCWNGKSGAKGQKRLWRGYRSACGTAQTTPVQAGLNRKTHVDAIRQFAFAVSRFSANESGLGYLYQALYALWLLLDGPEELELVLEGLDDIVLNQDGTPIDLLQTKHHSVPARLTDASPQLWKTLRIWSTHIRDGRVRVPNTALSLVTTAQAPGESVASALRPGSGRNSSAALNRLRAVASTSTNADLKTAFTAFGELTQDQQRVLVESIYILDGSPDISDIGLKIQDRIRAAVDRQNRNALYERLKGWWFGKIIEQLKSAAPTPIAGFEIYDKLRAIAEQFGPNALPIDYLDAQPDSVDPQTDNRCLSDNSEQLMLELLESKKRSLITTVHTNNDRGGPAKNY